MTFCSKQVHGMCYSKLFLKFLIFQNKVQGMSCVQSKWIQLWSGRIALRNRTGLVSHHRLL